MHISSLTSGFLPVAPEYADSGRDYAIGATFIGAGENMVTVAYE